MKKLTLTLSLLMVLTTSVQAKSKEDECQAGQKKINDQKALVSKGIQENSIALDLQGFFKEHLVYMQQNHDAICSGKALPQRKNDTYKEKQLAMINEGLENGQISLEVASFLLDSLEE